MRLDWKSAGLAMTVLLVLPWLPLPVGAAQPSAPTIAFAETSDLRKLLETAKQHHRRAEFKQAIALYQRSIELSKQQGTRSNQAQAMAELGSVYAEIEKTQEAEALMLAALKLAQATGDRRVESDVLAALVSFYLGRPDLKKAKDFNQAAQMAAEAAGYQKGIARAKTIVSAIRWLELLQQKQFQQALEVSREVLTLAQGTGDQDDIATVYSLQFLTYSTLQNTVQAEKLFQQHQAFSQAIGFRLEEYRGLKLAGDLTDLQKQPERKVAYYQQALAIAQAADNSWFQRSMLLEVGWFHVNQKQTPKALEAYQKALALAKTIDNAAVADVQNRIGVAYYRAEQYPQAMTAYQQALATYQKTKDNQAGLAQVWINIGDVHSQLKQYPKTVEAYQQALAIYHQLKNESNIGNTQNRIGNVFYLMEQYPRAIEFYQQALAIYQKLNKQPDIAQTWTNIGNAYQWSKQYPQALNAFQEALKLHQAAKRPGAVSQAWENIGDTYRQQEQYSKALEAYQQALEIARAIPDRALELNALMGQGFVYTGHGQSLSRATAYKEAIATFEKGVGIWQQVQILSREIKRDSSEQIAINQIRLSYMGRGSALVAQQQYAGAIAAYQQGLVVLRQHRDRLPIDQFLEQEYSILEQLGNTYSSNGQYAKALITYQEALQFAEHYNNLESRRYLLQSIATTFSRMGDYQKALETSQRLLALVREKLNQDPKIEMSALIKIGQILSDLGQYTDSLTHYQQALEISRTLKDSGSEATLLSNISNIFSKRGEYLQALKLSQQSLAITQTAIQRLQSGDEKAVEQLCSKNTASLGKHGQGSCLQRFQYTFSTTLNNLAFVYDGLGRYPEALKTYEQALGIAQQHQDLDRQTTFLNNIGTIYLSTGNYPKASEFFQKSLAIAVASGARPLQAITLNNIGRVYKERGQPTKALDYYQQSLVLAQAIQDPDSEATALNNIGGVYETQGEYARALEFFQKSLAMGRKHGSSITTELNNIAYVYLSQGKYPQAVDQLQQALDIARKTGDRPQEVVLLRNLGAAYHVQSNYAQALELYQQAQKLSQAMGSRSSELVDLLAQGLVYIDLGQYPPTLKLLQQALALSRNLGQRGSEATAIGNIAAVYRKQEKYPQALQFYHEALTLFREIGDVAGESTILQKIAQTYEKQGNVTQAEALLQQALTIQRKTGARPNEAWTLNTLGRVYTAQGKVAAAQETLQQALTIAQSVNALTTQAETLADLGKLFQTQPELAIVFYKQSVKLTEDIRKGIRTLPKDQQQSYTETVADTYRQLADLLLKRDRVLEAQQVLDLLKLQELDDYLRNVRGGGQNLYELPPEQAILKKYNALNESAIALGQELNSLQDIARSGKALTSAQEQRKEQLLKLQADLKQQFNDFAHDKDVAALLKQLTITQPDVTIQLQDLAGFSKKLAMLNAVMVYPLVLDKRLELIITAPNAQPLRRTVNVTREELNQTIQEFRAALQDPTRDAKPAAQKLYTWLIKPLEADLQAAKPQTIIYAPDGLLRYIPLAALYDGQKWLVERYAINNITSKSVDELTTKPEGKLRVLAGAFGTADQQVPFAGQTFSFHGLAFTVKEVEALAKRLPGTVELLGQAFTPTATTKQMNEYTIVHLATHASLVPEVGNSFIVFGNGTATSLTDIEKWTLDTVDLIVLSACETGLGGKFGKNGEEVLGLGYQFTQPGRAKAAIASLWSVNDGGTQALMDAFYANLQTGKTKAEALRQAQITLITGKAQSSGSDRSPTLVARWQGQLPSKVINQLNHPYYWAPFILIGNGL